MPSFTDGPWISARASPTCHFLAPDKILCLGGEADIANGKVEPIGSAVVIHLASSPPSMELKAGHERNLISLLKRRQDPGGPIPSLLHHNSLQTR